LKAGREAIGRVRFRLALAFLQSVLARRVKKISVRVRAKFFCRQLKNGSKARHAPA
jgi:hypothetical protein